MHVGTDMQGECTITDQELVDVIYPSDSLTLALFKSKGMPLIGQCNLDLDPRYEYSSNRDYNRMASTYRWRLKD